MHIWRNRGLRTLFAMAFVVALVFGGTSVPAANAGAYGDSFDSNPVVGWKFDDNASYAASGFEYNQGTAFSAPNNAWIVTTNGWAGLRVYSSVPANGGEPSVHYLCTASIYIKPAVNDSVTFNLEVINTWNWTYVALKQVTLLPGGYKQVAVSWRSDLENVFVRYTLLSNNGYYKKARLDNYHISCVFSPL
jgi:hypothetical protein